MDKKIYEDLRLLEESLWRAKTRYNDSLMNEVFSNDFYEFGRSGRIYQRHELLLGNNAMKEIHAILPLRNFNIRMLSPEIAQVTYISEVRYDMQIETSNRSSIWRREKGAWRLFFPSRNSNKLTS